MISVRCNMGRATSLTRSSHCDKVYARLLVAMIFIFVLSFRAGASVPLDGAAA